VLLCAIASLAAQEQQPGAPEAEAAGAAAEASEAPQQQPRQQEPPGMRAACVLDLALRLMQLWASAGAPEMLQQFLTQLMQLSSSTADAAELAVGPGAAAEGAAQPAEEAQAAEAARRALLLQLHSRPEDACVFWLSGEGSCPSPAGSPLPGPVATLCSQRAHLADPAPATRHPQACTACSTRSCRSRCRRGWAAARSRRS
jgi:hypothetical protein